MTFLPIVALTFDDGPSEWTNDLLDVLAKHEARATFFVLGQHVFGNEKTLRRAVAEGHELGVHGWNHKPVEALTPGGFLAQIEMTEVAIEEAAGVTPTWWRPPWNRADSSTAVAAVDHGLAWCGVTLDGRDVSRGEDAVVETVLRLLVPGAVVGLHDGIAPNGETHLADRLGTVRAVDRILGACRSVTVSELLGAGVRA